MSTVNFELFSAFSAVISSILYKSVIPLSIKPEHKHQASVCLDPSLHDSMILLYDKSLKNSVMLPISFFVGPDSITYNFLIFITYYINKKFYITCQWKSQHKVTFKLQIVENVFWIVQCPTSNFSSCNVFRTLFISTIVILI